MFIKFAPNRKIDQKVLKTLRDWQITELSLSARIALGTNTQWK